MFICSNGSIVRRCLQCDRPRITPSSQMPKTSCGGSPPLTEDMRVTPSGDATECKIPVKYMDMVEGYVLTAVSHQIEMVEKNLLMSGRQENCVKDLERVNEASVRSHDTEDQEVFIAWDDVSRKAEMEK